MIRFIQIDNQGNDNDCNKKYICETKKTLFHNWSVVKTREGTARIFTEDELMAVLAIEHNKLR